MLNLLAQTRPFEPGSEVDVLPGVPEAKDVVTLKGLEAIFANIITIALTLAGLALFVMLIVGGFQYLTSGGEVETATKARKTLTYAFFGLVLVVAAFLILRFIEVFTGVELTRFRIIPE